jgi:glucose-6-phosphate isomerase
VWGINSFDQWGVELGKKLAQKISQQITQGVPSSDQDASTSQLLQWYLKHQ